MDGNCFGYRVNRESICQSVKLHPIPHSLHHCLSYTI